MKKLLISLWILPVLALGQQINFPGGVNSNQVYNIIQSIGINGAAVSNEVKALTVANYYTNATPHYAEVHATISMAGASGYARAAVTNTAANTRFFVYDVPSLSVSAITNTLVFTVPPSNHYKISGVGMTVADGAQVVVYYATNSSGGGGGSGDVTAAGLAAGSYPINGALVTNLQEQFYRSIPASASANFGNTRMVLGSDKTHNIDPGSWPFGDIRSPTFAQRDGKVFVYFSSNDTNDAVRGGIFGFAGNDWNNLGYIGQMVTNSTSGWDSGHVYWGRVFTYLGTNWMTYMGGTEEDQMHMPNDQVGLAYSTDGTNYTKYSGNPILTKGADYDNSRIQHPTLFRAKDGLFYLFYTAWRTANTNAIAFATSSSITGPWTKYSGNPVVSFNEAGQGQTHSESPTILATEDGYQMWFDGFTDVAGPRYLMETLRTATSSNLTNWTISAEYADVVKIFGKTNTLNWIFGPHIIVDGGVRLLWEDNSSVYLSDPFSEQSTLSADVVMGNGFMVSSNALTVIPTAPAMWGQAFIFNSNGYPFILLSTNGASGSLTWTRTNKLGW